MYRSLTCRRLVVMLVMLAETSPCFSDDLVAFISADGFSEATPEQGEAAMQKVSASFEENYKKIHSVEGSYSISMSKCLKRARKGDTTVEGRILQSSTADMTFSVDVDQETSRSEVKPAGWQYFDEMSGEQWYELAPPSCIRIVNQDETLRYYVDQSPGLQQGDPQTPAFTATESHVVTQVRKTDRWNGDRDHVQTNPLLMYDFQEGNSIRPMLRGFPHAARVGMKVGLGSGVSTGRVRFVIRAGDGKNFKHFNVEFDLNQGGTFQSYTAIAPEGIFESSDMEYKAIDGVWFPSMRSFTRYDVTTSTQHSNTTMLLKDVKLNHLQRETPFTYRDLGLNKGDRVIDRTIPNQNGKVMVVGKEDKLIEPAEFVYESSKAGYRRSLTMSIVMWGNFFIISFVVIWIVRRLRRIEGANVVAPIDPPLD